MAVYSIPSQASSPGSLILHTLKRMGYAKIRKPGDETVTQKSIHDSLKLD